VVAVSERVARSGRVAVWGVRGDGGCGARAARDERAHTAGKAALFLHNSLRITRVARLRSRDPGHVESRHPGLRFSTFQILVFTLRLVLDFTNENDMGNACAMWILDSHRHSCSNN
jgi:hypothetical protein